jgi:hypothetical protein
MKVVPLDAIFGSYDKSAEIEVSTEHGYRDAGGTIRHTNDGYDPVERITSDWMILQPIKPEPSLALDLEAMSKRELLHLAAEENIPGRSKMSKPKLIEALNVGVKTVPRS